MEFYGFCARARRGGICRRVTEIGITRTEDFVVGETLAFGKNYLRYLLKTLIWNGL
jgi:hypothetical protein